MTLTASGVLLCSYVAVNYSQTFSRQHQLAAQWRNGDAAPQVAQKQSMPGGAFAKLLIPKLGLDTIVVEGATWSSLRTGPGHVANSALPGTAGNSVIAGHRDTFFRNLDRLSLGDSIYVDNGRRRYHYTVTTAKVVSPSDTSVLAASNDARLTLITCYPMHYVGPAPKRLVVIAQLQAESPEASAADPRPITERSSYAQLHAGLPGR